MGQPAARVTDMHVCPMVTPGTPPVPHVGGPIIPPCSVNVFTCSMPQARVSDKCICVGPLDVIVKGSMTVLVNNLPAARMGDTTVHGGTIVTGAPNVLIGDAGGGSVGGGGPLVLSPGAAAGAGAGEAPAELQEGGKPGADPAKPAASKPAEDVPKTYGKAIKLDGDAAFRKKTIAALDEIKKTKTGKELLESLDKSGKTVTIKPTTGGNAVNGLSAGAMKQKDGKPGAGSDSTVKFNPDRTRIGSEKWESRPPAIGLAHELIHAQHAAEGSIDLTEVNNDSKPDPAAPKGSKTFAKEKQEEVRTVGIDPYDKEPFSENKIRSEWPDKQTNREWY